MIRENAADLDAATHVLSVSRNLERIADHATNIGEGVLCMLEGEVVRHRVGGAWFAALKARFMNNAD